MAAVRSGEAGRWLVPLLLLLGVLAPTACVLWFMNVAVDNQRDASRRKLAEAYRGQLTLLRARADSFWEQRAAELARAAGGASAPAVFQKVVEGGMADAAIVLAGDGSPAYPAAAVPVPADAVYQRPDWMAARALENWNDFAGAAAAYASIVKEEHDVAVRGARGAGAHTVPDAERREARGAGSDRGVLRRRPPAARAWIRRGARLRPTSSCWR